MNIELFILIEGAFRTKPSRKRESLNSQIALQTIILINVYKYES